MVGPLSDRQMGLVSSAVSNAGRLELLVNDLLDMERLDDGKLPLHPQRVRPGDLARQAVAGVNDVAAAASIPLSLTVDAAAVDTWVTVDPNRMVQVLTNLLGNAIKFSDDDQPIDVVVGSQMGQAIIAVIDHGPGIPESHLSRIFDRFTQVNSQDSRREGGVGLGLAIAGELVRRSGGTLDVESSVGQGSTFTVRIPASAAPDSTKTSEASPTVVSLGG